MTRQILVVDDEPKIRSLLRAYLEAEGFAVTEVGTGADALHHINGSTPPDLVLLDVGLPDMDGFDVLSTLRRTSDVYVIVVTARTEEVDRLVGLTVGADDYVTKPFSPREVVARVKTVLRRMRTGDELEGASESVDRAMRFPDLTVDPDRREVHRHGEPVDLTSLQFDLLSALASEPRRVFSRAQLLERVWGGDFYGDERVVDVHIRNLRKALDDDASSPTLIGTVRGVGYRFLAEPVAEDTPGGGAP